MADTPMLVSEMAARILAIPGGADPDPVEITLNSSTGLVTATDGVTSDELQLSTQSGSTKVPTILDYVAVPAGKYTTGDVKVKGDANLVAGNIKKDVSIFGVTGSYDAPTPDPVEISLNSSIGLVTATDGLSSDSLQLGTRAGYTVTPASYTQTAVAASLYTTGPVLVAGDSDLAAANIKKDVEIFGVTGTYEGVQPDPVTISFDGSTAKITATDGITTANRTLNSQAALTVTPGTQDQVAVYSNRYLTGNITVKGDADLVAANIVKGINIFGVTGTAATGGVDVTSYKQTTWQSVLADADPTRIGWYFPLPSGCPDGLPKLIATNNPLTSATALPQYKWQPGPCTYVWRPSESRFKAFGIWYCNTYGTVANSRMDNYSVITDPTDTSWPLAISRETINGQDSLVFTMNQWNSSTIYSPWGTLDQNYHQCMCYW